MNECMQMNQMWMNEWMNEERNQEQIKAWMRLMNQRRMNGWTNERTSKWETERDRERDCDSMMWSNTN